MQKVKAISFIVFGVMLAYASSKWLEPKTQLDKKVLEFALSDSVSVVGYRNNTGNATVGFRYHYYVKPQDKELSDLTPFLITNTPTLNIRLKEKNHLSISMSGDVYRFNSVLWVKNSDNLMRLNVDFSLKN